MRRTRRALHALSIGALCVGGCLASNALAQDERRDREPAAVEMDEAWELIEQLKLGASALERLERHELSREVWSLAERLHERVEQAKAWREKEHDGREAITRDVAEGRLEVLRRAFEVVVESGDRELAEHLGRTVRVYQAVLEGAEGERAERLREAAPGLGDTMELIGHAAHLLRERNRPDVAERLIGARDRLWEGWRNRLERDRDEHQRDDRHDDERAWQDTHHEMLRLAAHAYREGERHDELELLERAIHAAEMHLANRDDREAREIRKRSPDFNAQVRLLMGGAHLWDEFGHEGKAARLREYAHGLAEKLRERESHEGREDGDRRESELIEARMRELMHVMHELESQMDAVRRELDALRARAADRRD